MILFFKKMIKYLLVPLGLVYSLFRKKCAITILMYHRVNDSVHKELSVKKKDFLWQMEYLKRKGWKVISLEDAAHRIRNGAIRSADKCVVLTFDDGYEDFSLNAFPILSRYGYASTIYLVLGYIETNQVFWWDADLGESRLMSWKQIMSLKGSTLVQFGSHTMRHIDLNLLDTQETRIELSASKDILQQKLSQDIWHFAYPRGIVTEESKNISQTLYETAVSIFDGSEIMDGQINDLHQLKRLPVQRSDGKLLFVTRLNGWLTPEEWLRRLFSRL